MNEDHLQMVEDCETRESRLTDWERNFIDSIRRQLEAGRSLTKNQMISLDETWERVTAKG